MAMGDPAAAAVYFGIDYAGTRAETFAPAAALRAYLQQGDLAAAARVAGQLEADGTLNELTQVVWLAQSLAVEEALEALSTATALSDETLMTLASPAFQALTLAAAGDAPGALASIVHREGSPLTIAFNDMARALILENTGQAEAAGAVFDQVMSNPLRNAFGLRLAGDFYWRQGQLQQAGQAYGLAQASGATVPGPWYEALNLAQQEETAAPLAPPVLPSTVPAQGSVLLQMLAAVLAEQQEANAAELAIAMRQVAHALNPADPLARYDLGLALINQEDWAALLRLYAGRAAYPPLASVNARAQMRALLALELEAEALALAVAMEQSFGPDPMLTFQMGSARHAQGDYAGAVALFEEAAEALDGHPRLGWLPHFRAGVSYHELDDWASTEAAFLASLDQDPDQPATLNFLGYSWVDRGERVEEALAMIERAVEQTPDSAAYVDSLGWALYRLARYDEAVGYLQRAVDLAIVEGADGSAGIWEIYGHLGDAYAALNRERQATFYWRQSLSFLPDDGSQADIREELEAKINTRAP